MASSEFEWVESELAQYIREQNHQHRARTKALSTAQKSSLMAYFKKADIDRVRILSAANPGIAEPAFYQRLRALGMYGLPEFPLMQAATFDDVIVACGPMENELLIHEMVHVTQYRLLGVERFASLYVRGFLASGSYESIPLEVCARHLVGRYMQHAGDSFEVEEIVVEWMDGGRF